MCSACAKIRVRVVDQTSNVPQGYAPRSGMDTSTRLTRRVERCLGLQAEHSEEAQRQGRRGGDRRQGHGETHFRVRPREKEIEHAESWARVGLRRQHEGAPAVLARDGQIALHYEISVKPIRGFEPTEGSGGASAKDGGAPTRDKES